MTEATNFIVDFLRAAWGALALALVAFSALAMLAQALRVTSGSALGASLWVWEAVGALVGILVLAVFGIWGVPAIIAAGMAALPGVPDCGPVSELGHLALGIIGGLGAVRMLKAVLSAVLAAGVGAGRVVASGLVEVGEAILGMTAASAAYPIAAHFLGVC
jgi:hypothetical protein